MGHYILLVKLTEKGKADINNALKRREEVMDYVKKLGGKNKDVYMTFGKYDVVEIMELPNDEAAMKCAIRAAQTGDVKVETMRAFTADEMKKVTGSM